MTLPKTLKVALAGVICTSYANAAITITAEYIDSEGGVYIQTTGGSLDLSLWNFITTSPDPLVGSIQENELVIGVGNVDFYEAQPITNFSGPATFGTLTTSSLQNSSLAGFALGFQSDEGGFLYVPEGYVSGDPTTINFATSYWATSLASLGLTPGTSTWTWDTAGGGTDSLTFTVIPEPSSALLTGLGCLAVAFMRRRSRR